jgi:hypothetical protein
VISPSSPDPAFVCSERPVKLRHSVRAAGIEIGAVKSAIYESVGGVKRKKDLHLGREVEGCQGAGRAFISTLDSPLRPAELEWERSETKFSEASFLKELSFSVFFQIACIVASTGARL